MGKQGQKEKYPIKVLIGIRMNLRFNFFSKPFFGSNPH